YAPTQWPLLGPVVDKLYDIWASWRLKLTGRPDLTTIIAQRNQRCQSDTPCQV
ncbi:MAG: thiol-disulfide oxidoreductase, partial [Symploca sp. SIO2G7]|nr:thiol-disulfide oxidoreductase [Symploca sp. SIO2G7]